jgi:hypothetical protein
LLHRGAVGKLGLAMLDRRDPQDVRATIQAVARTFAPTPRVVPEPDAARIAAEHARWDRQRIAEAERGDPDDVADVLERLRLHRESRAAERRRKADR